MTSPPPASQETSPSPRDSKPQSKAEQPDSFLRATRNNPSKSHLDKPQNKEILKSLYGSETGEQDGEQDKELYKASMALMAENEYEQALKKLQILVDNNPESVYLEKALFLIGDAHMEMGDHGATSHYKKAIDAYEWAMRRFSSSERVPEALFNIGWCNEKLKIYYEAEASYKRLIAQFPEHKALAEAYYRLGEVEYAYGDYADAGAFFSKVIEKFPGTRTAGLSVYRLGDSFYEQNDLFNAFKYYTRALRDFPEGKLFDQDVLFNLGEIYFQNEEYKKARETLLKAVNLFPDREGSDMAMARIGDSQYQTGDVDAAIYFYSQTIENYPDSESAMLSKLRIAQIAIGKLEAEGVDIPYKEEAYGEPLQLYEEVIEKRFSPEVSELAMLKLGIALSRLGKYQSAIEVFRKLLRKYPKGMLADEASSSMKESLKGFINFEFTQQYYISVLVKYQQFSATVLKDLDDIQLLYQIGESFRQLGMYQKALQLFTRAIRRPSNNPYRKKILFQAGRLNLLSEDYFSAAQLLTRYVEEFPDSPMLYQAYKLLGDAYYHLNDYQNAFNSYFSSLLMEKGSGMETQTYYFMGNSIKKLGDHSMATNAYKKVINHLKKEEQRKATPVYLNNTRLSLADSFFDAGNFSKALKEYEQAVTTPPEEGSPPWATYRIARSYEELGLSEKAVQSYKGLADKENGFWEYMANERIENLSWQADYEKNPDKPFIEGASR